MALATLFLLLGLFCLIIAPRYHSIIGFRGILYLLNKPNTWNITNRIFGIDLIISSLILLFTNSIKLFVILIILSLLTTDFLSYKLLKSKNYSTS